MRFLVDECVGPKVSEWLRAQGHEAFSVYEESRGVDDVDVLRKAESEDWVIITADKDFGERIFRDRHGHRGVILLRLQDERPANRIQVLGRLIEGHAQRLVGQFVVATETKVRFAQMASP